MRLTTTGGSDLPGVIRDLHTSMATGRDVEELLAVVVMLHVVKGTQSWLGRIGASPDLCWQAALLARHAAREHGGSDVLGLAAFGAANGLLDAGDSDTAGACTITIDEDGARVLCDALVEWFG